LRCELWFGELVNFSSRTSFLTDFQKSSRNRHGRLCAHFLVGEHQHFLFARLCGGPQSWCWCVRLPVHVVLKRLVVSDYFLVEDLVPGGVINAEGDMKVHVIDIYKDHLDLDKNFNLDLSHDVPTGPARPHAVIVLPGHDE
jgi:hypothetical protein